MSKGWHLGDDTSCPCRFCAAAKRKVMTNEDWLAVHTPHLSTTNGAFAWEPLAGAPDGYPASWRVCPCGAKHLTMREDPS